jgi:hypothetical protein
MMWLFLSGGLCLMIGVIMYVPDDACMPVEDEPAGP